MYAIRRLAQRVDTVVAGPRIVLHEEWSNIPLCTVQDL